MIKHIEQTNIASISDLIDMASEIGKTTAEEITLHILSISPYYRRMGYKHTLEKVGAAL